MRNYSNKITLAENSRGVWVLDTIMGCKTGIEKNSKGCFSDCYAARAARIYGWDFSKNTLRHFENEKHLLKIRNKINKLKFPFVRVGSMGDPSEDWNHTISTIEKLQPVNKEFVIITRHWNKLNIEQLNRIKKLNICINTSVSAIDDDLHQSIEQHEILKKYCNSILRCVSFNFNINNKKGLDYSIIQDWIFNSYDVLDTVFRCSPKNKLAQDDIINIKETKFLGKKCYISKMNKKAYFGNCNNCIEKCGLNM
jgi:hypothetical protein